MFAKMFSVFFLILNFSLTYAQFSGEVQWATGQGIGTSGLWIGDFNGDGMDDKINLSGPDGGSWYIALSTGNSFESSESNWGPNLHPGSSYYIGDFNGDGYADILYKLSTGELRFSQGNGSSSFYPSVQWYGSINSTVNLVGDFNGDGADDFLSYNGMGTYLVYTSNKSGFNSGSSWLTYMGNVNLFAGDFNGDGLTDIANLNSGNWKVAFSHGTYFSSYTSSWGVPSGASSFYIGDFNADSKSDRFNYYGNGVWDVSISTGSGFESPADTITGQGIGASGFYFGDFNGDGYCDKASYFSFGEWWVATRNTDNIPRTVAAWYTLFYDDTALTSGGWNETDSTKIPVTGWGTDAISGRYDEENTEVMQRQIRAMKKAGINLVILDLSNIYKDNGDPHHDSFKYHAKKFFEVMLNEAESDRIPISILIGAEFWAQSFWTKAGWSNWGPNWDEMYQLQEEVLDSINQDFVNEYVDSNGKKLYYYYQGKPLVQIYLWADTNYAPNLPHLFSCHDFTIKPVTGYGNLNSRRFWWYGRTLPMTRDAETMTVMPGRHVWVPGMGNDNYERDGGDFYINSWLEVIRGNPLFSLITDWNNWNEEYAIEGCLGTNGWKDYRGNPQYDWYLQITQAYSYIFKNNSLPNFSIYIQDENYPNVYYSWNGSSVTNRKYIDGEKDYPNSKPIIKLPHSWLTSHGYNLAKIDAGEIEIPISFETNAYPNPFNPTINIEYTLPETGLVEIKVYDVLGREVETLVHNVVEKGSQKVLWQAGNFASGVYFYRISWKDNVISKKIVLMK